MNGENESKTKDGKGKNKGNENNKGKKGNKISDVSEQQCYFSEKYRSSNGIVLLKNGTVAKRKENRTHGYVTIQNNAVDSGQHCWRIVV